jgi:hypothetical protein
MALSGAEHRAMKLTGILMNIIAGEIIRDGPARDQDLAEAALRIHGIQHMILAQSAAREHPGLYRQLGGQVSASPTPSPPPGGPCGCPPGPSSSGP